MPTTKLRVNVVDDGSLSAKVPDSIVSGSTRPYKTSTVFYIHLLITFHILSIYSVIINTFWQKSQFFCYGFMTFSTI